MEQVYKLLLPARLTWSRLGDALGAPLIIWDGNQFSADYCLRKMLNICLDTNKSLTWSGLCEALRTPSVDRDDVAEDIEAMMQSKRKRPILRSNGAEGSMESDNDTYGETLKKGTTHAWTCYDSASNKTVHDNKWEL